MSIQTSLTGGSILTEKRRKKKTRRTKNEEKEKVKKSLLVKETNRAEQKIEIEGIGIVLVMYTDQHLERENWVR